MKDSGRLDVELEQELTAMQAVGRALASVSDPAVRARVLQWAVERFGAQTDVTASTSGPSAAPPSGGDGDLTLDGVQWLFDGHAAGRRDSDDEPDPRPPLGPVLHRREHADASGLETIVHSFVDDFRRLAQEWQSA